MYTSWEVAPSRVDEAEVEVDSLPSARSVSSLLAWEGVSEVGFGWKVRSAGTEPGWRVCGLRSGLSAMVLRSAGRGGDGGWLGAGNARLMVDESFGLRVKESRREGMYVLWRRRLGQRLPTLVLMACWESLLVDGCSMAEGHVRLRWSEVCWEERGTGMGLGWRRSRGWHSW